MPLNAENQIISRTFTFVSVFIYEIISTLFQVFLTCFFLPPLLRLMLNPTTFLMTLIFSVFFFLSFSFISCNKSPLGSLRDSLTYDRCSPKFTHTASQLSVPLAQESTSHALVIDRHTSRQPLHSIHCACGVFTLYSHMIETDDKIRFHLTRFLKVRISINCLR